MSRKQRRARTGSGIKLAAWAATLSFVAACADLGEGSLGPASEDWADEDALVDEGIPDPDSDPGTGAPVDDPDPAPADDPCLEFDDCPETDGGSDPDGIAEDVGADDGAANDTITTSTPKYDAGDVLLVLAYAKLRKHPNKDAGTVDVHTGGGAHGGHPKGTVPPGQEVVVLGAIPTNKYYKVKYKSHPGWMHRNKLELFDTSVHPVKFARRWAVRNAFFMHQLRRARWNKDGLSSSTNCAPTSLAMAAKIFGYSTPGKTIEQSIHEARLKYDPAPLCEAGKYCGTSRAEIRLAAQKMGFHVKTLNEAGDTEYRMQRIDKALANKHVMQLEGWAGSKYRARMTEAYRNSNIAWVNDRVYTYGDDPEEYHSILVVSRLANGKYLVADPLSEVGMVTMNRATLKSYFSRWGGTGNVVW